MNKIHIPEEYIEFEFSRIDRSVADNLKDIDVSFGNDGHMVLDFILFISKKINNNLFGFTKFSLADFAKFLGISKSFLSKTHPDITLGKVKPPVFLGMEFSSFLDYNLLKMLRNNIIFSKPYTYKEKQGKEFEIIQLTNFPILKDIKIFSSNGITKYYEVRLSDTIIEGFIKRYYTLDTSKLPAFSGFKGAYSKKKLFIFLNKIFHIHISYKVNVDIKYSIDYLADIANVRYSTKKDSKERFLEKSSFHKKEQINRILTVIRNVMESNSAFSFNYEFIKEKSTIGEETNYYVLFHLISNIEINQLLTKLNIENKIFYDLWDNLKCFFNDKYPLATLEKTTLFKNEKDPFQGWLNNHSIDLESKAKIFKNILTKHFYQNQKIQNLSDYQISRLIINGFENFNLTITKN